MYEIKIDNYHPTRLNQLMNVHWSVANKKKKADTLMISACSQHIPKALGKRRVELIIEMGSKQRCADVDAFWKVVLDSLVRCRLLVDDHPKHCEIMPVQFPRGKKSTTIRLHDV